MAEALTPDTAGAEAYRVQSLHLDWAEERIRVWVKTPSGDVDVHAYRAEEAVMLMRALNKADLSVKSLHRRLLEKLVADEKIPAGTISGEPE